MRTTYIQYTLDISTARSNLLIYVTKSQSLTQISHAGVLQLIIQVYIHVLTVHGNSE